MDQYAIVRPFANGIKVLEKNGQKFLRKSTF